ncbi:hypothetical protein ACLB1E_20305 [Escherichia coli]
MRKNVELLTGFSNRYDVPEQMTISIGTVFSTGDTRNISLVMTEQIKPYAKRKARGQQSDYSSYLVTKIFRAMLFAWLLHTIYYDHP